VDAGQLAEVRQVSFRVGRVFEMLFKTNIRFLSGRFIVDKGVSARVLLQLWVDQCSQTVILFVLRSFSRQDILPTCSAPWKKIVEG